MRDAQSAAAALDVVRTIAPGAGMDQVVALEDLVSRATAQPRFTSRLVAAFGALAVLLAAVGIYATLSFLVGARAREIGIRLALGAPRRRIVSAVVWRGLVPAMAGGVLGVVVALVLARTFRALLFAIEPADLPSVAGGAVVLLIAAAAAALLPARRAARVDPVRALRVE